MSIDDYKYCPECGSEYIEFAELEDDDEFDGDVPCGCMDCMWEGFVSDLVREEDLEED